MQQEIPTRIQGILEGILAIRKHFQDAQLVVEVHSGKIGSPGLVTRTSKAFSPNVQQQVITFVESTSPHLLAHHANMVAWSPLLLQPFLANITPVSASQWGQSAMPEPQSPTPVPLNTGDSYSGIERSLPSEIQDFVNKHRDQFDGPIDTPEELRHLLQMLHQSEGALAVPNVPAPQSNDGGLGGMSPQDLLALLIEYLKNLQEASRPAGNLGSPSKGWLGGDRNGGNPAPPRIPSRRNVQEAPSNLPPPKAGQKGIPSGLRPNAARGAQHARQVFNFGGEIGGRGSRPGPSDHPSGNAIDVMTQNNKRLGQDMADYYVKNKDSLNVKYVIFNQRIASPRTNWQWSKMRDRGSATQNHLDHVHISFKPS